MGDHTHHRKWSVPGVPHKGWSCVHVEDLGEPSETCGMCESAQVRFVHYMEHPSYPDTLGVGCVCAEHLEGDYDAPRAREKVLRKTARRRKTWVVRKWRLSAKGNYYLNAEGFNLVVFQKRDANGAWWAFKVENRQTNRAQFSRRRYPTEVAAKNATFDALLWAKQYL
jgi:hypothetical protein